MPVNLDALRSRLTSSLADGRISRTEAQGLAWEAKKNGLAPEVTAFLKDALARNADKFESGAADVLKALVGPSTPSTPVATPTVPAQKRDLPDPAILKKHDGQLGFQAYDGKLFVDGAKETDVLQGSIANCYMVSSFAAIAHTHPDALEKAIRDNGDGTYTVKLWQTSYYGPAKQVEVTVDGQMPTASGSSKPKYAKDATAGELWVPILEKAFAQWKGSYDAIGNGGSPNDVMGALLGTRGTFTGLTAGMNGDLLYTQLKSSIDSGKAVVAATHGEDQEALYQGTGMYAWHAYTVLGVSEENGQKYVTLRNPWGYSEPTGNGPDDGVFKLNMADFSKYYAGVYFN